mgnify:CR=1 FL=1
MTTNRVGVFLSLQALRSGCLCKGKALKSASSFFVCANHLTTASSMLPWFRLMLAAPTVSLSASTNRLPMGAFHTVPCAPGRDHDT